MITEQHLQIIEERNIVIKQSVNYCFVYIKGHEQLGRYFENRIDKVYQENIHALNGSYCTIKDVQVSLLPYVLSYISDYNLSLFYYKEGNYLKLCKRSDHYKNPILIRNHDNIWVNGKFIRSISLRGDNYPETIDIYNTVIMRNPSLNDFMVLDNTKKEIYVTKSQILDFLAREKCEEAVKIACDLLVTMTKTGNNIRLNDFLRERLEKERPVFYNEIAEQNSEMV